MIFIYYDWRKKNVKKHYHDYLQSDDWKHKRDKRIMIDKVCQICGRPFDLNVHHMTYKNVPFEKMGDLITVCKNCHSKIEAKKYNAGSDSFDIVNDLIAMQFCQENLSNDLSGRGKIDFCKTEVIKQHFLPYLKQHGGCLDRPRSNTIQAFFRDRRYKIIEGFIDRGYPEYICYKQTLFSRAMIHKVYTEYKKQEEEENAET